MKHTHKKPAALPKRRPVTLSVRHDLMAEAKALGINASRAAESGLVEAIRTANERAWLTENADAIEHYNKAIQKSGIFYTPEWANTDGPV